MDASVPRRHPKRKTPCRNCKERKVKCSGERPTCRTCANSNRFCRGYEQISNPATPHREPQGRVVDGSPGDEAMPASETKPLLLPAVSPRHAFRQQLFIEYITDQLPEELTLSKNRDQHWFFKVLETVDLTPALESIILASCTARLGKRDGRTDLTNQSIALYQNSIRALQQAIDHPGLRVQDQTLATCIALTNHEVVRGSTRANLNFINHYNGTMELLHRRGAAVSGDGLGYQVFRALRLHSTYISLLQKRPSFLAEKEWLEVPWASRPPKTAQDKLTDIMLKLPAIYKHDAEITDRSMELEERLVACLRCARICWRFDHELTYWLKELGEEHHGPLYWVATPKLPTPSHSSDSESPPYIELFPASYDFPSFLLGYELLRYWISRVILSHQLCETYRALERLVAERVATGLKGIDCTCPGSPKAGVTSCLRHFMLGQLPPLGYRKSWTETIARNICQSVNFFMQEKWKATGRHVLMQPTVMMNSFWERDEEKDRTREIAWATQTIAGILAKR